MFTLDVMMDDPKNAPRSRSVSFLRSAGAFVATVVLLAVGVLLCQELADQWRVLLPRV